MEQHPPSSSSNEGFAKDKEDERVDDDGSEGGGSMDDGSGQHHPIAEFLYQLTKMLTDDNNEIIEWVDGRIKVHYPERLEGEVLHKYFRHSKFASFQRQLNYFGFRKIAGKGKMSPCSYVNEAASSDIRSLLLIKRKTNGSAARKAAIQQQRAAALAASSNGFVLPPGALNGALNFPALNFAPTNVDPQALANAMAFLQQNSMAGLMPPAQRNPPAPDLQQLNLLNLQHQLFQKQLLNQQALQMQQSQAAALNSLLAQQQSNNNGNVKNAMPAAFPTSNLFNGGVEGMPSSLPTNHNSSSTSSLEQLQAQLKALTQQQQQHQAQSQPPTANTASSTSQLTAFLSQVAAGQVAQGNNSRATAALNAQQQAMQPATAAMNASSSSQGNNHHLFDSAMNLKSLLEEHKAQTELQQQAALLNRTNASDSANLNSTMSFGNMLGSSNRLSSLLSLNSFLGSSRETSLADFANAIPANVREQLTAEAVNAQLTAAAAAAHHENKYRNNHNNGSTSGH